MKEKKMCRHMTPVILLCMLFPAFGQLSVIGGSGPGFPAKVDSITFVVKFKEVKNRIDSITVSLDTGFLGEFKKGIDSTIHYVDAVRQKRKEIAGSAHGPKFDAFLRFTNANTLVMKVLFCKKRFSGALLDVTTDKYPFVITFKPDFAHRLDSLASFLQKKPVRH